MKPDIFTRIRTVATGAPTSDELRGVIHAVGIALDDEREFRSQFEQTAANPLVDTAEAERAQGEITRSHLKEQRLEAGLKLLNPKLAEVAEAERQAQLVIDYDALRTERDALVTEFRKVWPKHAGPLVALLRKLQAFDDKVPAITTPEACEPLMSADGVLSADPKRSIVDHARLPVITLTDAPAWDTEAERAEQEQEAAVRRARAAERLQYEQGLMARYGTTDPLIVARKAREEREARERTLEERRTA